MISVSRKGGREMMNAFWLDEEIVRYYIKNNLFKLTVTVMILFAKIAVLNWGKKTL